MKKQEGRRARDSTRDQGKEVDKRVSECVCQILMLCRLFIHNSRLPRGVRTKQYIFYQEEVKCTAHNPLTVLFIIIIINVNIPVNFPLL